LRFSCANETRWVVTMLLALDKLIVADIRTKILSPTPSNLYWRDWTLLFSIQLAEAM
jgi:hypothetical protein